MSDCRSRGREFDPGLVLYFRGDWSWNGFYGHSPPFRWFIQEGLLSVTSESICTNYWLTACSSLPSPGKRVVRWTDRPAMTWDVKQQNKQTKRVKIAAWVSLFLLFRSVHIQNWGWHGHICVKPFYRCVFAAISCQQVLLSTILFCVSEQRWSCQAAHMYRVLESIATHL